MPERRSVTITGLGLLCPAGLGAEGVGPGTPGPVPGFRARDFIEDRKSLKLMTETVRLGVAAINMALESDPSWSDVAPHRRGLFVGTSPQLGDPDDLQPALLASMGPDGFDMQLYAEEGYPLIHPLWLIRGLSNNVIGFASAIHDLQGVNANYCHGVTGGWNALREGALAVAEGRADLVIAGGTDAVASLEPLVGRPCGDGAAFAVLRPGDPDVTDILDDTDRWDGDEGLGFLGAATYPVAVARWWLSRPL